MANVSDNYPILYKRTATGAIQVWWVECDNFGFRTHSGQEDGAIVTSEWTQVYPKNVGRSNETSTAEQAHIEVQALYKKKLAQGGYHTRRSEIDNPKFFKPMLAKKYEDRPIHNWAGVSSQPKLDGVRCIATADGLWSRTGKPLVSTPHIMEALIPAFEKDPDAIFDGELYADHLSQDFNTIISYVRKTKPTYADLLASRSVQYHVYDFPSCDSSFSERFLQLSMLFHSGLLDHPVVLVPTHAVQDEDNLDFLNGQYIEKGYEGQIIRLNGPYENKRSPLLLKRKVFQDGEYEVVAINEGKGNRSGMAGFITYRLLDGRTFDSGIRGSHDYARQLLKDAPLYEGAVGTVRYFNLTPSGIPRFPITVALHPHGRLL